jgi:hypothetical protein
MGGDILYRWGKPSNYGMLGTQAIPNAVHDARWITDDGRPNGGFLQIFNNSGQSSSQSTIDGIDAPLDPATGYTYILNPGEPYGPASYTTRYVCAYSASGQSASDRMSNGNIYVNASGGQGGSGVMYEVNAEGNIVWGPYNSQTQKGFRYECDHPGIIALEPYMNSSTSSCNFLISGCTNPNAINYDPTASVDDGSCIIDCSADLNGDNSITVADLLLVLSEFGCIENCDATDVNGDGVTTVADLLELLSVFGTIC